MKKVLFLFALGVLVSTTVRASVLFYDNFQQFPPGTVLTETNYLPNIGIDASVQTNNDGFGVAAVTASNLQNSVRAFFNVGTLPYSAKYRGDQNGGSLTNANLTLSFHLWIPTVQSATHLGGFAVDVLTTNIDSIDGSTTNLSRNPLIFINDGGQVYTFTNTPSLTAPLQTVMQIGSWSNQVGTVMSNALTVNFASNTFSYAINGTTLTNMPLPGYITNIFDTVSFEVFEAFTGTVASVGNQFALDGIQLTAGPADTNQDVVSYIAAAKGQFFDQLTTGAPTLSATGWAFHSDIQGSSSNSLLDASLTIPGGAVKTLTTNFVGDAKLQFNDQFTSQSSLDAAYPSSAPYTLAVDTAHQGTFRPSVALPADNYPTNAPQIVNFDAAQAIQGSTNFVLQWAAFGGGTTNDFISVSIDDNLGNSAFATPDIGATNALDGTVTSVLLSSNTLAGNTTYQGQVLFIKRTNTDTNSIPGAFGLGGFFKQTTFSLMTVTALPPAIACTVAPVIGTNTINSTYTATATVFTNGAPVAAGVVVNFSVSAGPNVGNTGTGSTGVGGQATFSYSSSVIGTDTIQAAGIVGSLSFTGTATEVWLATNVPPVAVCQDVTVPTSGGCLGIVSAAQVDNGSSDSDGIIVSRVLSPTGPYALGVTPVTLTVTDDRGATNSCSATVTVVDQTPPIVMCPSDVVTNIPFGGTNAVVSYPAPVASDNCTLASTNSTPPSGSTFSLGTNVVTFTATDAAGNTNSCNFNVIVGQAPPQADLAVTASSNVATASLNNAVGYTLVVTNQGPQDALGAQLVDTLPDSATFSNSTTSVGICTNINGILTCDFGTLTNGTSATVTVIVTPTNSAVTGICSGVAVSSSTADPVATNSSLSVCTPVVIDNMAVTAFKAPKKVTLTDKKTNVVSKLTVTIQNRSLHSETIPDMNTLSNLVTITLTPLATNLVCAVPVAEVTPPKSFPITLASGKSLKVNYTVTFTCATDPLATSKTADHNDYQYLVAVHHEALDGVPDSRPADDVCPHDALGQDPYNPKIKDKGCGLKQPDKSFGPVVTDIVDNRTP